MIKCPGPVSVLGRSPTESVSVEELDPLQTDLEVLLASVGRRLKLLESEIQVLQNWQDKKDTKTSLAKGKVVRVRERPKGKVVRVRERPKGKVVRVR